MRSTSEALRVPVSEASPAPLLELRNLEVRYGGALAVNGISIEVRAGEAVGLVGPNGAGKSSTLLAIMGAVRRSGGEVLLYGHVLPRAHPDVVARLGVAMVPEGRHLFSSMTVRENLLLGRLARRPGRVPRFDEDWVADVFPMTVEFANRPAGLLSGGQQQQVAIARALLADPDLLLLDEPSLGLAPVAVSAVFGALEQVRGAGVSMLLVEQRAELTLEFCSRSYVLASGRIQLETGRGAAGTDEVVAAYFGR